MHIIYSMVLACLLDLIFADPMWLPHPVVFMGKCISGLEKRLRSRFPDTDSGLLRAGCVLAAVLPVGTLILVSLVLFLLGKLHPVCRFALETFWCFQALAIRGMARESRNVYCSLNAGTIEDARHAVARIVGRDTAALTHEGVIKATVETVAENFSDGVIAPMFYMAIGGAPLALMYKAINTMDSMVGYRNDKYLYFGRAAARLDDVANFIPSRIAAFLLMGAGTLTGQNAFEGFRIWSRDRRNHASPNSAQTESVMAGALGVQLGGPASYFGMVYEKPTIGDDRRSVEDRDILRANRMLYAGSFLGLLIFGVIRFGVILLLWGI